VDATTRQGSLCAASCCSWLTQPLCVQASGTIAKAMISGSALLGQSSDDPHCACAISQELQTKHRILKPGFRVVDLGAAPGGWSLVAHKIIGDTGQLVGVDLLPMDGVGEALLLQVRSCILRIATSPYVAAIESITSARTVLLSFK
jgi:FtsJ-like methyltransferase